MKSLLKIVIILSFVLMYVVPAFGASDIPDDPDKYPVTRSIYQSKTKIVDEFGDTITRYTLKPFIVYPPLKFKNKKEEDFYWLMVSRVRKTLPYAKMIKETLIETYEYIQTFPDEKDREDYLKMMEKELFNQYKPVLKKLSRQQANVLIKLIQRETDQTSYQIVKAFLGNARAFFWQGFGKLFGVSLRGKFQPEKNKDDAIIERIATLIEQGQL